MKITRVNQSSPKNEEKLTLWIKEHFGNKVDSVLFIVDSEYNNEGHNNSVVGAVGFKDKKEVAPKSFQALLEDSVELSWLGLSGSDYNEEPCGNILVEL